MTEQEDFFDRVYAITDAKDAAEHYAKFAGSYETAMQDNGYITPTRCAETLLTAGVDTATPVLDIGCGTGLSGGALNAAGFKTIDGLDFSAEMLAVAKQRGLYRTLSQDDLSAASYTKTYGAVVAAGVLSPGHAPASALDDILTVLEPEGVFVFSLNDHAIADGSYEGRIHEAVDCGTADIVSREYGPHMPGQGLMAWVFALRKR